MKILLFCISVLVSGLSFSQQPEKNTQTVITTEKTENKSVEKISNTNAIEVKKIERKAKIASPAKKEELKKSKSNTRK